MKFHINTNHLEKLILVEVGANAIKVPQQKTTYNLICDSDIKVLLRPKKQFFFVVGFQNYVN